MGKFALLSKAFLLGFLCMNVFAAPGVREVGVRSRYGRKRCENPIQRKEWRTLSEVERRSYIHAELCVMHTPGTLGLPGAVTKFDELVSNHQIQGRLMHATGVFLPYHRYFMFVHEILLRECGWTGGIPYWNETLDVGKYAESPIFDNVLGFGGNGEGPDGCLLSGAFSGLTTPLGPGFNITTRCVSRNFTLYKTYWASQDYVDACDAFDTYEEAWPCFYGDPHHAGHGGVGGVMGDALVSPADPIFYMHHSFIDKIWWDWQEKKPEQRLFDVSGPNAQDPAVGFPEFEGSADEEARDRFGHPSEAMQALAPSGKEGDGGGDVTTLDHVMTSLGIVPDVAIREVMDTRGQYLCYEYV